MRYIHRLSIILVVLSLSFALFFLVKVIERNKYIKKIIDASVTKENSNNIEQIALSISKEIYKKTHKGINKQDLDWYSRIESTSFFNVTSAVSLKYEGYGIIGHSVFGPCGTMSRTLLNALWKLNIPARKLILVDNELGKGGGHTMIEFQYNGSWRVLSPSDNSFVWRTENGEIATASQIKNNPIIFSQIYKEKPNYPYLFDNYKNIRWEKLPNLITSIIKIVIGEKKFNSMETPRLYDLPRTLFLYYLILQSIFFSIVSYFSRFNSRRSLHHFFYVNRNS